MQHGLKEGRVAAQLPERQGGCNLCDAIFLELCRAQCDHHHRQAPNLGDGSSSKGQRLDHNLHRQILKVFGAAQGSVGLQPVSSRPRKRVGRRGTWVLIDGIGELGGTAPSSVGSLVMGE